MQEFEPSDNLTVICGKNGQGKTNLIESVWLLSGAKSFRQSKDAELIKKESNFAVLDADCYGYDKKSNIRLAIGNSESEKKGRYAKINGVDYGRATNIAGVFTAVVFAPNHLSLVKGSPDGRRRFLDAALCQIYPSYISVLRKYARYLTQKNALLKNKSIDKQILSVLNDGLAQQGTIITQKREEYINSIFPIAKKVYEDISKKSEQLTIKYEPCFEEKQLREILEDAVNIDIKCGFSTQGPHREDFLCFLDEQDTKVFASQGQQRSTVLSLKLAEAAMIKQITGEHPVMLLDDVLSELDFERQEYLLCEIKDKQTMVTACDHKAFLKTNGVIFEMENGKIKN